MPGGRIPTPTSLANQRLGFSERRRRGEGRVALWSHAAGSGGRDGRPAAPGASCFRFPEWSSTRRLAGTLALPRALGPGSAAGPSQALSPSRGMRPFCRSWRTGPLLLLLLAGAVRDSWQTEEKTCDLVGEKGKESENELALLKRLKPLYNKSFESTVGQGSDTYVYMFRVCREAGNHSSGAGLVQISKSSGKETVVGRLNETHIFNGSNWIMLIYKGGDEYDNHCGKEQRRAVVMISCNRRTLADNFNPVSEERGKVQDCFYLFEMDSSLACSPEVSHLSVGSVLLVTTAVTLCADLNPETCLLRTAVWGMTSWGRSQKKGMTIYYRCDHTLNVQLLQPPNQSILSQISKAASTPVPHLPLNTALAFRFAFGLHPLLSGRNTFPLLPVLLSLLRCNCRTETVPQADGRRSCCTLSHYQKVQQESYGNKRVWQAP